MTDWVPETRDVDPELEDGYEHQTYPPALVRFNTIADQLNDADRETLRLYVAGGTGEVNWRNTEIGTE